MNTITSAIKFTPEYPLNHEEINRIIQELTSLRGIKSLTVDQSSVNVEFYHLSISPDLVKDALVKAGFPFKKKVDKSSLFTKFITTLANDNKKTFGGNTPGCCGH